MYVFLGLLYSEDKRKEIINYVKTPMQGAANTYQWGLLNGLKKSTDESIEIINSVPMGTFPTQSKIFKERSCLETQDGITIDNVGYVNLPIIKQRNRYKGTLKRLTKLIKKSTEPITIVLYSLYYPYLKAISKIKKKFPNVQYILIVPDLPCEYGIESSNLLKRKINRRVGYKSLNLASKADSYVLLTEQMNGVVNKQSKPYEIIEGIAAQKYEITENFDFSKKVILYTGSLNRVYGIDKLIDSFFSLNDSCVELWFAGGGDMADEIKKLCKQQEKIKYFGFCSKEEVLSLQEQAFILVNPRSGKGEYSKYSFPSKTMEYLSTGKPVAMNKLQGVPSEYSEYLYFFSDDTKECMAETFRHIFSMSKQELLENREKQLKFIRENKVGEKQAKKLIKLKEGFIEGK